MCKFSMLRHGYIQEDEALKYFVHRDVPKSFSGQKDSNTHGAPMEVRSKMVELNPLMLRGYWSRVHGIWQIVDSFIQNYVRDEESGNKENVSTNFETTHKNSTQKDSTNTKILNDTSRK